MQMNVSSATTPTSKMEIHVIVHFPLMIVLFQLKEIAQKEIGLIQMNVLLAQALVLLVILVQLNAHHADMDLKGSKVAKIKIKYYVLVLLEHMSLLEKMEYKTV